MERHKVFFQDVFDYLEKYKIQLASVYTPSDEYKRLFLVNPFNPIYKIKVDSRWEERYFRHLHEAIKAYNEL